MAICETLPAPADRAMPHYNLAIYLERSDAPSNLRASPLNRLAALVYRLVANAGQALQTYLRNYALRFRHATDLQAAVDRFLEQTRQVAAAWK